MRIKLARVFVIFGDFRLSDSVNLRFKPLAVFFLALPFPSFFANCRSFESAKNSRTFETAHFRIEILDISDTFSEFESLLECSVLHTPRLLSLDVPIEAAVVARVKGQNHDCHLCTRTSQ